MANADELQIKMAQGKQAIKQVALARYSYVANADELQIKMAQGKQKNHLCGQRWRPTDQDGARKTGD